MKFEQIILISFTALFFLSCEKDESLQPINSNVDYFESNNNTAANIQEFSRIHVDNDYSPNPMHYDLALLYSESAINLFFSKNDKLSEVSSEEISFNLKIKTNDNIISTNEIKKFNKEVRTQLQSYCKNKKKIDIIDFIWNKPNESILYITTKARLIEVSSIEKTSWCYFPQTGAFWSAISTSSSLFNGSCQIEAIPILKSKLNDPNCNYALSCNSGILWNVVSTNWIHYLNPNNPYLFFHHAGAVGVYCYDDNFWENQLNMDIQAFNLHIAPLYPGKTLKSVDIRWDRAPGTFYEHTYHQQKFYLGDCIEEETHQPW